MPWQRGVLDVALECDKHGLLHHRVVVITVPRQQGKSTLLQTVGTWGALRERFRVVMHTAQSRQDARDRWAEAILALRSGPLIGTVLKVRESVGSERTLFRNGSVWRLFSPTDEGAHGASIDVALLDEAWALGEHVLQAIVPATQTRPDPQIWLISTAGTDDSKLLRRHVAMGRDEAPGVCYFEWSAPDDADPADPQTWRLCMPALGVLVSEQRIAELRRTTPEAEFARAFLNRWTRVVERVIGAEAWASCREPESQLPEGARIAFGADVAGDRSSTSICVAGIRPDGRLHVELVEQISGTERAPQRLLELAGHHDALAIAVDPVGPSATVLEGLQRLGHSPLTPTAGRYAAACASFFDAVREGRLVHRGQAPLDAAVAGAGKRVLSDAWAWSRRQSRADIAPLVAATIAAWALESVPTPGAMFA